MVKIRTTKAFKRHFLTRRWKGNFNKNFTGTYPDFKIGATFTYKNRGYTYNILIVHRASSYKDLSPVYGPEDLVIVYAQRGEPTDQDMMEKILTFTPDFFHDTSDKVKEALVEYGGEKIHTTISRLKAVFEKVLVDDKEKKEKEKKKDG